MNAKQLLTDVLQRFRIETDHSKQVHNEVKHWQQHPQIADPKLLDWTNQAFVTIDNPDSRDLDQALLIESSTQGYRCRYALADASFYVKPGSHLFKEALKRGASYYLPGRSIPMLPVALSEDLISLNADVQRRALVFDMWLTPEGVCTQTDIVRARIQSFAKLSYEGVQRWLDERPDPNDPEIPVQAQVSLKLLKELGQKLIDQAQDRDVIQFDRRETDIQLNGEQFELRERDRYDTERYNEQISLLCNMQGAKLLQALDRIHPDMQPIFRVHEAPLKKSMKAFQENLTALIESKQLGTRFQRQAGQSLADYIASLPNDAQSKRLVQAIERQVLMTNQASKFRAEPGRHHALGAESYARFSSPMREIVGIYTHKELLEALGSKAPIDPAVDASIRAEIIEAANSAKQRQKQIGKAIEFAVIDNHLKHDLEHDNPHTHLGTVMGFRSGKIYVAADDLAVDLKVYLDDLAHQYQSPYSLTDISAKPTDPQQPSFVLGDAVALSVRAFDKELRRYRLNLFKTEL